MSVRCDSKLLAKAWQTLLMSEPIKLIHLKSGGLFCFKIKVIIASLRDGGRVPLV